MKSNGNTTHFAARNRSESSNSSNRCSFCRISHAQSSCSRILTEYASMGAWVAPALNPPYDFGDRAAQGSPPEHREDHDACEAGLSSGARTHSSPNGLTQLFDACAPAIHIRTMLVLHARLGDDIGKFISELGNLRRVLLDVLERLITEHLRHWCSLLSQPSSLQLASVSCQLLSKNLRGYQSGIVSRF